MSWKSEPQTITWMNSENSEQMSSEHLPYVFKMCCIRVLRGRFLPFPKGDDSDSDSDSNAEEVSDYVKNNFLDPDKWLIGCSWRGWFWSRYCWWKKSCTTKDNHYPIICRVSPPSQVVVWDFFISRMTTLDRNIFVEVAPRCRKNNGPLISTSSYLMGHSLLFELHDVFPMFYRQTARASDFYLE